MNPYLRLRVANRGRGDFRAEGQTLWLYDVIASDDEEADWLGGVSPTRFAAALAQTTGPVRLRVNSPGGSVFGGLAMAQAIRQHGEPITVQVDALAASAATLVVAAAARAEMARGSMLMVHRAWSMTVGDRDDMMAAATVLEMIDGQLAQTYAARSGVSADDWAARMAAETWMDAEGAVAAGLADEVMNADAQRGAQARFDLSAFASAPQALTDAAQAAQASAARDARVRRMTAAIAAGG